MMNATTRMAISRFEKNSNISIHIGQRKTRLMGMIKSGASYGRTLRRYVGATE
jgi:hypothetical protein